MADPAAMHSEASYLAVYGLVSVLLVTLVGGLLYVACSRRYRLNWFEKNLLEAAEKGHIDESEEALVEDTGEGDKFWVPPSLHRQNSFCPSDVVQDTSGESSPCTPQGLPLSPQHVQQQQQQQPTPGAVTPEAPTAAVAGAEAGAVALPLARSDKHVVLATAPARPRVSSMHTKLDHTKIDTSLYQKALTTRSPSLPEEPVGSIQMALAYDPAAGILTVRLLEAHDLQARDFSGTADPYAKIRLLPDRGNVWQTRIHKKTLNPVFDEDFVFEVSPAALPRRTLEVLLYDFDAYSRHHSIGGVQLPLAQVDLSERLTLWRQLGPCADQDAKAELGEVMVSLSFLPSAERLTVVVLKARNLRIVDDTRASSDPFVKVALVQGGKRVKKKKTGVHRNTVNPVFNEALTFDVSREALSRSSLEIQVLHDSLLGPSELLGRVLLGSDCGSSTDRAFFSEAVASKTATARWLQLSEPQ
ncbi:synaptotagmin-5 isoform X2 [Schistocerca serialis cubense]|uniref:synaptotagmin-5 isoform X2 n=1 Tax=Schistocerca serialis cubense TaxID=2023355 RepID=UPI00214E1270|nr:synaptotagmin-5 isoform X2 [Schistocerca serialis cubense]